MARTQYEAHNAAFSQQAHEVAQQLLYPSIFGVPRSRLSFEDTLLGQSERASVLDGEMGVDRIVRVMVEGLKAPLLFTIQERFRRPEYARYRDITVTEWNHASSMPSELYKINAGLFVYGYYDDCCECFVDAIVVNVFDLLLAVAKGDVYYSRGRNRKQQKFLSFRFADLTELGLVRYRFLNS